MKNSKVITTPVIVIMLFSTSIVSVSAENSINANIKSKSTTLSF